MKQIENKLESSQPAIRTNSSNVARISQSSNSMSSNAQSRETGNFLSTPIIIDEASVERSKAMMDRSKAVLDDTGFAAQKTASSAFNTALKALEDIHTNGGNKLKVLYGAGTALTGLFTLKSIYSVLNPKIPKFLSIAQTFVSAVVTKTFYNTFTGQKPLKNIRSAATGLASLLGLKIFNDTAFSDTGSIISRLFAMKPGDNLFSKFGKTFSFDLGKDNPTPPEYNPGMVNSNSSNGFAGITQ